jgi:VIT1/CCC1 family predicted Fe2+/Mn2+ transporter
MLTARARHVEGHFTGSDTIRDIVFGMADGLTVPFALAAGLSAIAPTNIVVTAGLAEIAAGSISMGLGGYLAAKGDIEHYDIERRREAGEIKDHPDDEEREVAQILRSYGVEAEASGPLIAALRRHENENRWVDFMMQFELGLSKIDPRRAVISAITIALAYALGGAVPLLPYVFAPTTQMGLLISIVTTLTALAVFGYIKGRFTGVSPFPSAFQTVVIGGVASAAAFLLARAIS